MGGSHPASRTASLPASRAASQPASHPPSRPPSRPAWLAIALGNDPVRAGKWLAVASSGLNVVCELPRKAWPNLVSCTALLRRMEVLLRESPDVLLASARMPRELAVCAILPRFTMAFTVGFFTKYFVLMVFTA